AAPASDAASDASAPASMVRPASASAPASVPPSPTTVLRRKQTSIAGRSGDKLARRANALATPASASPVTDASPAAPPVPSCAASPCAAPPAPRAAASVATPPAPALPAAPGVPSSLEQPKVAKDAKPAADKKSQLRWSMVVPPFGAMAYLERYPYRAHRS